MRYRKTIKVWVVCFLVSLLMYGYFETPNMAMEKYPDSNEIYSTKSEYTVERLGKEPVQGELQIHYLDVGQADCTLVVCDGYTMLIDTGLDDQGTKIQYYLKKLGIERIDYLVLTHTDADHIGSADVILTKFEIGTTFLSNFEKNTKTYQKLLKLIDYYHIDYLSPAVGNVYALGSASFQILAPNREYEEPNNMSISLLLTHGENTFLFTGDAEKEAEGDMLANGLNVAADVYHVGHHGSKTSTTEEFLDTVMPRYAVISCGQNNPYGLPDAKVLNYFREREIKVFRTDEQGTIVLTSNGEKITFNVPSSETWQAGERHIEK